MQADTALIEAGRRGDHAAFARIVERYQNAVYAVSYASTRDRSLADDVTQETFVAAWRGLAALRDGTRLPAWLCGIARNRARDALKRRRREHADDVTDAPDRVDPSTPFDALSDAEAEHLVATALDAVPAVYREPLVLFYIEQRSVDDVARALGLNPRTTNKRLSRGRQQLAARVGELERTLALRGPKRDLVACVLAAIGLLGTATHADASPAIAKGSIMPTLALATVLVATVGGVGLLSASVANQPGRPSQPAGVATPQKPRTPSNPPPTSPTPSRTSNPSRQSPPSPPRLPAIPNAIPDCAALARHLAQLTLDQFPSAKQLPTKKYEEFLTLRSRDLTERCTKERWSDDRRACAMTATHPDDEVACRNGMIGTDVELANLPAGLRCDAVAQHLATLATAPDGKFGIVAAKMAQQGKAFDLAKVVVQVRDQTRDECDRIPWSLAVRRCMVASKTHDSTVHCR